MTVTATVIVESVEGAGRPAAERGTGRLTCRVAECEFLGSETFVGLSHPAASGLTFNRVYPRFLTGTDLRIDELMIGCLVGVAAIRGQLERLRPYRKTLTVLSIAASLYLAWFVVAIDSTRWGFMFGGGETLAALWRFERAVTGHQVQGLAEEEMRPAACTASVCMTMVRSSSAARRFTAWAISGMGLMAPISLLAYMITLPFTLRAALPIVCTSDR